MAIRFTDADVKRVTSALIQRYGTAIRDMSTFLRAYDSYASDSYIARSSGTIPTEDEGSVLDGSDPNNFCACVCVNVFSKLKIDFGTPEEKREKLAPEQEVRELEAKPLQHIPKARRVAKGERHVTKFNYVGREKGHGIVYARRITIFTKYGTQTRYIDNKGRYVSVKK